MGSLEMRWLIASSLAVLLPLHGLALATMDLRGAAHYHEPGEISEAPHEHAHERVERHRHAPGEGAIVVEDGEDHGHDADTSHTRASFGFDSLTPAVPLLPVQQAPGELIALSCAGLPVLLPGRLERPPDFPAGLN